jgi:aspartate ammonia-lyase
VGSSVGVVTALVPIIGYDAAATLAKQGLATGRPVADLVVEAGLMTRAEVALELTPARLARETVLPLTMAGSD